jgi:hypothetical protein
VGPEYLRAIARGYCVVVVLDVVVVVMVGQLH